MATDGDTLKLIIENGGARDLLLAQLSDIGRIRRSNRPVFTLRVRLEGFEGSRWFTIMVLIDGLTAKGSGDEAGCLWNIVGEIRKSVDSSALAFWLDPFRLFTGHYDTRHRSGELRPQ